MRVQYLTHLAFNGRVSKTICAITDDAEMLKFVREMMDDYDKLPTVNPAREPIPTFETAADAVAYFKEKIHEQPTSPLRKGPPRHRPTDR